ncbi:hypothetical protein [Synoicihabitans lomoniglobus]|uniref:PDGLE domain-containing protein n=1 Tax=Synoicihabitans lomoniglobus TaxID=2909285 RepID=A0AAF0CQ23_9BACT|nr:hypothetical protein [Opitutaceae bacterium LMO-M01]WED65947.1 hypothetical protein PXH66_03675 [Opitutaceae bacterium LMO-M01]
MPRLRPILRFCAAALAIATIAFWAAKGAHPGWSMDKVPVTLVDEITEIEYTTYEEHFVPGLEYLAGGIAAAAVLFGLSFLVRSQPA